MRLRGHHRVVWSKPEEGWIKMNCDADFMNKDGVVGLGIVVKDSNRVLTDNVAFITVVGFVLLDKASFFFFEE